MKTITHLSFAIFLLSIFNRAVAMDAMSKVIESPAMATNGLISFIMKKERTKYAPDDLKFVQQKIKNKADVNELCTIQSTTGILKLTPLEAAVKYNQHDLASMLKNVNIPPIVELLEAETNINIDKQDGETLLMDSMSKVIETPAMATNGLISSIVKKKYDSYTPDDLKFVQQKIKNKADLNKLFKIKSTIGSLELTPLEAAVNYNQHDLASMLINAGANVDRPLPLSPGYSHKAISYCNDNIPLFVELLEAGTDPNKDNQDGDPLLHEVLFSDDSIETIKEKICWLIFHNADPEKENYEEVTAFNIVNDSSLFPEESTREALTQILNASGPEYAEFYQEQNRLYQEQNRRCLLLEKESYPQNRILINLQEEA